MFSLWKSFVKPRNKNIDLARREYILNILILGIISLVGVAFLFNTVKSLLTPLSSSNETPLITGITLLLFIILLVISRKGKSLISGYIFIILLFLLCIYGSYRWGPDLPEILLLYVLLIVITGILINTKAAFVITVISGGFILLFSYLAIYGLYRANTLWKTEDIRMTDSIVYTITLGIITIVSWLSNREIEKALHRAWRSETALKKQRDLLEITVEKRTRELRQAQSEKIAQLYRFAEFGKLASGLFHDLANPLTLISLNLSRLHQRTISDKLHKLLPNAKILLDRVVIGTKRLENFVYAARKQVQNQEVLQHFLIQEEINQVIQLFTYKTKHLRVNISFDKHHPFRVTGNVMKFNQLITNILSNAIDAYDGIRKMNKQILVSTTKKNGLIVLTVQDWGIGISQKNLLKIFDPFFTTKGLQKGTGLGLSICKEIVEKNFGGSISVTSKRGKGTIFTVEFPAKRSQKQR